MCNLHWICGCSPIDRVVTYFIAGLAMAMRIKELIYIYIIKFISMLFVHCVGRRTYLRYLHTIFWDYVGGVVSRVVKFVIIR